MDNYFASRAVFIRDGVPYIKLVINLNPKVLRKRRRRLGAKLRQLGYRVCVVKKRLLQAPECDFRRHAHSYLIRRDQAGYGKNDTLTTWINDYAKKTDQKASSPGSVRPDSVNKS